MSVHARLTNLTLVYCCAYMAYTHRMRTQMCLTPDRHGLPPQWQTFLVVYTKGEHFNWYSTKRFSLYYYHRISNTSNISTQLTSNVMRYDMVSLLDLHRGALA